MEHIYYNFKNKVNDKPTLLTLDEIEAYDTHPDKEYYMSVFRYNEEHKKYVKQYDSVANIRDVITSNLVWDFDSKDLEVSKKSALTLADRLVNKYNIDPDTIITYFSGSKGIHVILPLDKDITPSEFKAATYYLASDLEGYDASVSAPTSILRLENTKNLKTGLYKIPLHLAELDEMSIDQIKELAKTQRDEKFAGFNFKPVRLPKDLFILPKTNEKEETRMIDTDFSYDHPPKGWKKYKWALAQGHFESGERHNALMVLAATGRSLGYDRQATYYLCKSALKKQAERTNSDEFPKEELWNDIIESVFSENWKGGAYSPQNNQWLRNYCEKMGFDVEQNANGIIQMHNIEAEFIDFVKNIDKNTIYTGIPSLDEKLPLTIGMNLGVLGSPSSGKTAMALKILKNTSDAGVISVFASLDMRRNRLFEKLLYRVSGLSRKELYERIQKDKAQDIFAKVREEYKNVYFYDRSCPTVGDIRRYITSIEEETGQKVKLVMLDYFERVNADKSDETAASKEVAGQLQDLVNDFNICMITLVQPNKFSLAGGPDKPLLNYTAIKGSSFMFQAFRSIISIWRPFFTPEWKEHDKYLQMAILKNDLGELDMFNFGWDGRRGEIWELGEEGEEELKELLRQKAESQTEEDQGNNWS